MVMPMRYTPFGHGDARNGLSLVSIGPGKLYLVPGTCLVQIPCTEHGGPVVSSLCCLQSELFWGHRIGQG